MSGAAGATTEGAADFARRFAEFWAAPAPDRLDSLLAERVRLVAPMTPTTDTLADGERVFANLLRLIPDATAEVHEWGATEAGILIHFTVGGSVSGVPISWRAVDRIAIGDDGLATERVSYFDTAPLLFAVLRHPRTWPAFARSRLSRR
jgi:SnoaL-like domain